MPPEKPLLTIAIPTYNRATYLKQLLDSLAPQLKGRDEVELIISDNASEDETPTLVDSFRQCRPGLRYIRNETNIGPDRNFLQCFEEARGRYVWMIGDDDVLLDRALAIVLGAIHSSPAIIHIASRSFKGEFRPEDFPVPANPKVRIFHRNLSFTKAMNVWATFISGIVVSKELYSQLSALRLEDYLCTNLIQLSWVLPLLGKGDSFVSVSTPLVASTADNTGGYQLADVFGRNLRTLTRELLQDFPRLQTVFDNALIMRFFPSLVIKLRLHRQPGLTACRTTLRQLYNNNLRFWLFLYPVLACPRPIARAAAFNARLLSRFDRTMGYPLL